MSNCVTTGSHLENWSVLLVCFSACEHCLLQLMLESNYFVIQLISSSAINVHVVTMVTDSPHGVEVIIWGNVVLIITGQAELVAITLMDKVPKFFGTQGLLTSQSENNPTCVNFYINSSGRHRTGRSALLTLSSSAFCHSLNIIMQVLSLAPNEVKKCCKKHAVITSESGV